LIFSLDVTESDSPWDEDNYSKSNAYRIVIQAPVDFSASQSVSQKA
jgi:hypothetical protein